MSDVIRVNSLTAAREALCLAEGAIRHLHGPTPRAELIAAMIRDIDEQRPIPDIIQQAKAEAWDEGHYMSELGLRHVYDGHDCAEGEMCPTCCQPNPYRADRARKDRP